MFHKLLIIYFVAIHLCSGQNPTINLKIVKSGSILTCENTAATVFQDLPMRIQFINYEYYTYEITCRFNGDERKTERENQPIIKINRVSSYMGALWRCTIVTIPNYQEVSPVQHRQKCGKFCGIYCHICAVIDCQIVMHVRRKEAPQVILVNGMLLPSKQSALGASHDALAEYTFSEGDLVDVTCGTANSSKMDPKCYLYMDYNYPGRFRIPDKLKNHYIYPDPVGFQLRMRADNNNTYAICTCKIWSITDGVDDISTVRVNFLMRKPPIAPSINVYINSAVLRPTTDKHNEFEYQYKSNEYLHVVCQSVHVGNTARFEWIPEPNRKDIDKEPIQNETAAILLNHETPSFKCLSTTDYIVVKLKPRQLTEAKNECLMRTWLQHSASAVNPSLELYQSGKRALFYEYQDDDNFSLECTSSCTGKDYEIHLYHSGKHILGPYTVPVLKAQNTSVAKFCKNISKADIENDNVFECILKHKFTYYPVFKRTLVFIHSPTITKIASTTRKYATNMPSIRGGVSGLEPVPEDEGNRSRWTMAVIGSVACVVIISVIVVIYKLRNRKNYPKQPGELIYENLPNNIDTPIPPFPSQWESHHTELVSQDPTYSEPSTGQWGHNKTNLYAIPVPKAKRKHASIQATDPTYVDVEVVQQNMRNDLNYVEIGHSEHLDPKSMQPRKFNWCDNNPNYSQVLVQGREAKGQEGAGSVYTNVYNRQYTDANSEYAESIYCEPT